MHYIWLGLLGLVILGIICVLQHMYYMNKYNDNDWFFDMWSQTRQG